MKFSEGFREQEVGSGEQEAHCSRATIASLPAPCFLLLQFGRQGATG
jgi:hypothetical protein